MSAVRGLHPGARLGRHRLIERIAAGGMAEVFLARQEGPEGFRRSVAVKVVHPDQDDPDVLRSLIDEARVAAQLSHPNVVQIIELGELGDSFYLVMEFLDGWPVDELLKQAQRGSTVPLEAIVDLGLQLLDALGYAHDARDEDGQPMEVVHRDIKPSNLIVDGRGLLKVVDFGIARAASIERRTATGMGKGTPAYMAPEQLYGEEIGPGADLYAVGVLLWELAVRDRLFSADSIIALVGRRQRGYLDEDEARLAEVHPGLVPIVRRALLRHPEERYADAAEMADALAELANVRPRKALRGWLDVLVGDSQAFRSASESQPIQTLATGEIADLPAGGGTEPVDWQPASAPSDAVPPTRLQHIPEPTIDESDEPDASPGRGKWLLWLLLPLGLFVAFNLLPEQAPVPTPTPAPIATPAPPLVATPQATPAPRRTPSVTPRAVSTPASIATPAPTPEPSPTPEPTATPTPTPTAASSAPGTLFVNMVGQSGFVQVAGHGRKPTRKPFSLPAGRHTVQLLDLDGGVLHSFNVDVSVGQTARCVWRKTAAGLQFVPDPEGAPCPM